MKRALIAIGLLAVLVCSAHAQGPVVAKIPFDFVAVETTLPAGTYEFKPNSDFTIMQVMNVDTRKSVMVPVLTRLGTADFGTARLSFDKIGQKMVLETMLPGADDGYLFSVAKEKHTHEIVKIG